MASNDDHGEVGLKGRECSAEHRITGRLPSCGHDEDSTRPKETGFFQHRTRLERAANMAEPSYDDRQPVAKRPAPPQNPDEADCLGCRLIGSSIGVLAGSYILREEYKQRKVQLLRFRGSIPPRTMGARGMLVFGWGEDDSCSNKLPGSC